MHQPVDPLGTGGPECLDLLPGQLGLVEDAVADRVVDVVVDVGDPVDDAHDLPLEGRRREVARVGQDAVDDLGGEVQPACDLRRLLVVAEAVVEQRVERRLAGVPERRMTEIVAEADRLGEVLVQSQSARDHPGDTGGLEGMGHAGSVVVTRRVDEDLRLALQAPERLRVQDAVAVALERRPDAALLLGTFSPARRVRVLRERREGVLLQLPRSRGEGVTNSPGQFGHSGLTVSAEAVVDGRPAGGRRNARLGG